ncbi:MAG: serine hydrolase domain-containing protein [Candidatus Limnocylindrales bacterium]
MERAGGRRLVHGHRRAVTPGRGVGGVVLALVLLACSGSPVASGPSGSPPPLVSGSGGSGGSTVGTAAPQLGSPVPGATANPSNVPSPASVPLSVALAPQLQAELAAALARQRLPGLQATVVFVDGGAWSGAAGFADVAAQRSLTVRDVFDVGSITKTFVAAEVMRLVELGRLHLEDPLSRWLPAYPNAAHITLRELLNHTSGLYDYFWSPSLLRQLGAAPRQAWGPQRLLRFVGRPVFKPGTEWIYSNTNYLLLGLVIEAAAGRSVEAELEAHFLGPLGLDHTVLQDDAPAVRAAAAGPLALPYGRAPKGTPGFTARSDGTGYLPFTSLATALTTAGAVASRSDDIARWGAALYGGRLLQPSSLAAMEDVGQTRRFKPAFTYGLGTQQLTVGGFLSIGHGGSVTGYRAALRYFPAFGASIAVLTNLDGADPDAVVARLVSVLAKASLQNPGAPRE